nr:hypothetical protein [Tanacetum cinerariifolium]
MSEVMRRGAVESRPSVCIDVLAVYGDAKCSEPQGPPDGNIVTNSRETPSWREIVSLAVLVKLASFTLKKDQEKDKIESKQDKNGKRGEAEKCQKQLQ